MCSETYTYEALTSSNHIRLLKVNPNAEDARLEAVLEQYDLEDAIEIGYDAISYTWGEPTFTHQLYIGGQPLHITAHLHGALSFMKGAYIWVDAVCINQNDLQEKAQQIPLMRHIYAGCLEVLVWLGPQHSSIVDAMKVLEDGLVLDMVHVLRDESIDTLEMRRQLLEILTNSNVMKGIGLIFENDWFHRLWVIQETLSDTKTWFHCGRGSVNYFKLEMFALCVLAVGGDLCHMWPRSVLDGIEALQSSYGIRTFVESKRHDYPELQMADILMRTRRRKCADPRDRLYALGGVLNGSKLLPYAADYTKDTASVYSDFAVHLVQQSQLLSLLTFSGLSKNAEHNLASWIPDWRTSPKPVFSVVNDNALINSIEIDGRHRAGTQNLALRGPFFVELDGKYATLSVPAYVGDEIVITWHPRTPESNICGPPKDINQTQPAECLGSYLEQLLKWLTNLPSPKITWPVLWETLAYGQSLSRLTGGEVSESEEDESTSQGSESLIAVAISLAIVFWQNWDATQSHGAEASDPDFGTPLLDYLETVDTEGYNAMVEVICHEVMTSHKQRPQRVSVVSRLETLTAFTKTEFCRMLVQLTSGERGMLICITQSGRLGWVPHATLEGDVVAFVALDVPLILRPCGDGYYRLVGEAYIHGTMQGEMIKDMEAFDRIKII